MRKARVAAIIFGIGVILTQYQNCAGPSSGSSGSGTVKLVDDYNSSGIQFPQSEVQLYEDTTNVNLGGICNDDHDGQNYNWSIAASGQSLGAGQSACGQGQFQFEVSGVQDWVCGVEYSAQVAGEWGESSTMAVVKRCPPLASQPAPSPSLGQPQTCQLEYRVTGDDSNQGLCQTVCFAQGILSSLENEPLENCEGLIGSLAGQ